VALNTTNPNPLTHILSVSGSVITFRTYGITCLIILILYVALNHFFGNRADFSYGSSMKHQLLDEESPTLHLAPHGVPSGIARDLSSSRLKDEGGICYVMKYTQQQIKRKAAIKLF
jgi:hypothetical protein